MISAFYVGTSDLLVSTKRAQ